jgi:hypothetical protein
MMLKEAQTMHDFLNGCESSADAALNANARKAAGFHMLHDWALLKELHAQQPVTSANIPQHGGDLQSNRP